MSLATRLVGSWKLLSGGNYRSDGVFEPYRAFGEQPVGYLMYAEGGFMSVAMSNGDHPAWRDASEPTPAEKAASHDACFAYFGRYVVLEADQRVVHLPEAATWPHYVGSEQSRRVHLEDGVLTLSEDEPLAGGESRYFEIRWQRLETVRERVQPFMIPRLHTPSVVRDAYARSRASA